MAKVIAPNDQYTGLSASVMFVNGVGETDDPHLLEWFESKGYMVEYSEAEAEQLPQEPEETETPAAEPKPEKSGKKGK